MRNVKLLIAALLLFPGAPLVYAQAIFTGTWRPDPQRPDGTEPPDVIDLANGIYECRSCTPPYRVKADGTDQPVRNNTRFDTIIISVADARTVLKTVRKGTATVAQSRTVVSKDGKTRTELQTVSGMAPHPVDMVIRSTRLSAGAAGSHAISGQWRMVEADLVNHDEDTTYKVDANTLTMTDRLGRSFAARLDGTDAPYKGDPRFTTVSVKLVDSRTLEETDKNGAETVLITRWSVQPDGRTIRARFDNTHGFVQEQTGHKLP